jgi:hypothetical protein
VADGTCLPRYMYPDLGLSGRRVAKSSKMTSSEAVLDRACRALWRPFIQDIAAGHEVFFCFTAELLRQLFTEEGLEFKDAVGFLQSIASPLVPSDGSDVSLSNSAFTVNGSGFSAAIVLLCIQVIAVEEMVEDQSGFSDNAYFPRLRRLLGVTEKSLNPFSFDEFESIWRTVASEIRKLPGSKESSITFRFGLESGASKARSFPLSQALLSLSDLRALRDAAGERRMKHLTPLEVWPLLKRERRHLSRRSQKLVSWELFKDRIVQQVIAFARAHIARAAAFIPTIGQEAIRAIAYDLRITVDAADWLFETYTIAASSRDGSVDPEKEIDIDFIVRDRLSKRGYLVFVPTGLGDCWACSAERHSVSVGQTVLVVTLSTLTDAIFGSDQLYGLTRTATGLGPDGLRGFPDVSIVEAHVPQSAGEQLVVSDGVIVTRVGGVAATKSVWVGGICMDHSRQKYLREWLPTGLQNEGSILPISDVVRVDNRHVDWPVLAKVIKGLSSDAVFNLGFKNGVEANLAIAVERELVKSGLGFVLDQRGRIVPIISRVSSADVAVRGFRFTGIRGPAGYSLQRCLELLEVLRTGKGDKVPDNIRLEITQRVHASKIPESVKNVIAGLLSIQDRLPDKVILALTGETERFM